MTTLQALIDRANPNVGNYQTRYSIPIHWLQRQDDPFGAEYLAYMSATMQLLKRHLAPKPKEPAVVYDIGCGDGRMSNAIQEVTGGQVHGFDYSDDALKFARIYNPKATFTRLDLTEENLFSSVHSEEKADAIIMVEALEHVHPKHYPTIFSAFKNHLKPGGILIVSVPSAELPLNKQWHYVHFKESEFEGMLTEFGWTVRERLYNHKLSFWATRLLSYNAWRWLDNKFFRVNFLCRFITRQYTAHAVICHQHEHPGRFIFACQSKA